MTAEVDRKTTPADDAEAPRKRLALLSLAALGVVYGDIGTSPLYAIRECFHGEYGVAPDPASVFGVLSLMFWALVIVVSVKYLTFMLRADNRGEGGVIALTALVLSTTGMRRSTKWVAGGVGLFAAALLYGDGMITPAISVLSAVEGVEHITPALDPYVIPLTVAILTLLFVGQHRGTASIGALFGPVTLVWMVVLAALGIAGIAHHPRVLAAVYPGYAIEFLAGNHTAGFVVLGAVFLVVTGAEALYADMGHFGRAPIRTAWFAVAMPALVLNYFGQGAQLLAHPELASNPFYSLAPEWATVPLVLLATAATIIASQAVISGAFSLTRQAMQLGYLPRLRVVHTSASKLGQIYIPQINWLLMVATIALVLGFQSSSNLAAAYGVAVTGTMAISSLLFYLVARARWRWRRITAAAPALVFLTADLSFFGANISKVAHGAWFPLAIGAVAYLIMITWRRGRTLLGRKLAEEAMPIEELLDKVRTGDYARVAGEAVFLTGNPHGAPAALLHNLDHNKVLHRETVFLTMVTTEDTPRVPNLEKVEVDRLGGSFVRVVARFGFMETPDVTRVLALAKEKGIDVPLEGTTFFIGRERLLPARGAGMARWRQYLFAFLARNSLDPTAFYGIPPDQVVELGAQLRI